MYVYQAEVKKVVDGDTVDLLVDLGLRVHTLARIRLKGLDAPEMSQPGGVEARDWLVGVLPPGKKCIVYTYKDKEDKWGRWLGDLKVAEYDITINAMMLTQGLARHYDGGRR